MFFKSSFMQTNVLERIDIFGIGINIRFNKQQEYKSKIGGLITLGILGLLAYQIRIIVNNFLDTANPFVLFEEKFTSEPEKYDLTHDKFTMAFGLQTSKSQHYIDPQIYTPILYFKYTEKTLNPQTNLYVPKTVVRILQIEPCREDHFQIPSIKKYFMGLAYKNMYCISLEEQNLFLQGQFDSIHYATFELVINSCTGDNCKANMNDVLNFGRLAIYYVDNSIVPSDKYNPFQPLGRQSFWVSGPQFTKQLRINFRNTYLNSDYGLINEDIHSEKTLTFSSDREQTTPKSGNIMFDCFISLQNNVNSVYKRSYSKLDKALSQFGGIFNILFALGALLSRPLSQIELNLKLINQLFNFEEDTKDKNSKDGKEKKKLPQLKSQGDDLIKTEQSQKQGIVSPIGNQFQTQFNNSLKQKFSVPLNNMEISQNRSVSGSQENMKLSRKYSYSRQQTFKDNRSKTYTQHALSEYRNQQEKKNTVKELFSIQISKISFTGWKYFQNFLNFSKICKHRKYAQLQLGVDKLYQQIDIFYLIQKLVEIEKLKRLLLNENQRKLFEFIPKPTLPINEDKINNIQRQKLDILYEDHTDLAKKASDAQSAFQQIVQSEDKPSKIDVRIIELLDPTFKQYVQEAEKTILEQSELQRSHYKEENQRISFFQNQLITEDIQIAYELNEKDQILDCQDQSPRLQIGNQYRIKANSNVKNILE